MVIDSALLLDVFGYIVKTGLVAILTYLWNQIREYRKEQKNADLRREQEAQQMKRALQCLARDRLIQSHGYYTKLGWIPIHVMAGLTALYEAYEALGENGVIDNLMDQLKSLPNYDPKENK